jgi:hypothetical protein
VTHNRVSIESGKQPLTTFSLRLHDDPWRLPKNAVMDKLVVLTPRTLPLVVNAD